MAFTYFGGADEMSPMAPLGTQDWATVNPPEVRAAAEAWELQRRQAEEQRALMDQLASGDIADTTRAIAAAMKFQGLRRVQNAVAAGGDPQKAIMDNAAFIFADKPGAITNLPRPRQAAQVSEREMPGGLLRTITQPSGSITDRFIKSPTAPKDERLSDINASVDRAQTAFEKAQEERDALTGATRQEIIPAYEPGAVKRFFGAVPKPAMTNQIPVADSTKIALAMSAFEAAKKRLDLAEGERRAYQSRTAVPAPVASPAALPIAPPAGANASPFMATEAPPAAPPVQEVIRRTSGGRRAIFDAQTKKFLRYAD